MPGTGPHNQTCGRNWSGSLAKAGVKPWPKLFQNLRATAGRRSWPAEHPGHVAAAWLGHSTVVANKHYWQVTDADFTKAIGPDKEATEKAAQKTAQAGARGDSRRIARGRVCA